MALIERNTRRVDQIKERLIKGLPSFMEDAERMTDEGFMPPYASERAVGKLFYFI